MKNISIQRVYNLSHSVLEDCYYVISQSRPDIAESFYYDLWQVSQIDMRRVLITALSGHMVVGIVLGCLYNANFQNMAEIQYFFVDKKFQRTGIGTGMLLKYEAILREQEIETVMVKSAPAALPFYNKRGYIAHSKYVLHKHLGR